MLSGTIFTIEDKAYKIKGGDTVEGDKLKDDIPHIRIMRIENLRKSGNHDLMGEMVWVNKDKTERRGTILLIPVIDPLICNICDTPFLPVNGIIPFHMQGGFFCVNSMKKINPKLIEK